MHHLVEQFAAALDKEDYAAAAACLAEDCEYDSPTGRLSGPQAVINSYSHNGIMARDKFDEVRYRHELQEVTATEFRITFVDELIVAGRTHVFQCQQLVTVDTDRIQRISHREFPGERDRLNEFLHWMEQQHGT